MNDQLPDLWQADELEQEDFAQFLAEFVQDPLLDIPEASIPGPELDFACDHIIPHVSPSTCTAGALSSAALGPPAAQQSLASPETNLNGRNQAIDPKLEKIRAKNRRGQARYREKCKKQRQELESAIHNRQATLSQLLSQARRLRDTRSALLGRINAAAATPHPPPPRPPLPLNTSAPLIRSTSHQYTIFGEQLTPPRPPSAFAHLCPVSYADVAAHIPYTPPRSPTDPHGIVDALQSFLRATSNRLGCPPSDICFFMQLPFAAPPAQPGSAGSQPNGAAPRPLSHSAGVTSAPCCLTMSITFLALSIEATFLVREHACLLEASAGTGTSAETAPPDAEDLTVGEAPPQVAPLPDAAACRRLVLRCGVGDTCPLHDALAALLPPLLLRYRTKLPHTVWRRVCLQAIRVVQSTLDGMSAKTAAAGGESAETQGGDSGADAAADSTEAGEGDPQEGEMGWAHLDVAMKAAMKVMLHLLTAAVHEPAPQGPVAARTLVQTRQRMFDLMVTPGISCRMLFIFAPVAVRRLFMSEQEISSSPVQIQRLQNKAFKYLQLTAAQKADFAARWRCWFRRRFSLDRDFGDALARLHAALPTPDDLPLPLLTSACDSHGSRDAPACSAAGSAASAARPESVLVNSATEAEAWQSVGDNFGHESRSTPTGAVQRTGGGTASGGGCDGARGGRGEGEAAKVSSSVRSGVAISSVISYPVPVPKLYDACSGAMGMGVDTVPQPQQKSGRGVGGAWGAGVEEGGGSVRLLGAAGSVLEEVEGAMQQVAHVHEMDSHMHHEFVSLTTMPAWVLTELQQAKMVAAHLELGVSSIDLLWMFQVAASELRWGVLCGR